MYSKGCGAANPAFTGIKPYRHSKKSHISVGGAGRRITPVPGNRCGPPSTVATRLAREDASAIEPACDALPSANAKADALTTRAGMTSK